jgi:hypothetical protein
MLYFDDLSAGMWWLLLNLKYELQGAKYICFFLGNDYRKPSTA